MTSYPNNTVNTTDPAGKKRTLTYDSLGRLTQVTEDPGGLGYLTSYTYDALGNPLSVSQNGSRQRSFTYDALSRLTKEVTPEAGTISYAYDANPNQGDLTSVVAPAPNQTGSATVTTSYCYDALHRLTAKGYTFSPNTPPTCSNGTLPSPAATYLYDTANTNGVTLANVIGRLSRSSTAVVESLYSYDPMGRIQIHDQTTPQHNTQAFQLNYTYDLAGDTTSFSNGVGVTLSYFYDAAGRPTKLTSSLSDAQHPATIATLDSTLGYYPSSAIRKMTYGNGLAATWAYNNVLQPCRYNTNSSGTALGACTDAIPSSNLQDFSYGLSAGSSDNGNIASWTATGQQNFTRSFAYDSLNRIQKMTETGGSAESCKPASSPSSPYTLSWTIDAWGNRTAQTPSQGTCMFSQGVDTNNRLMGSPYAYDAAGNMTHDASHQYFYDAENRLIQVDGTLGTCSTATACYTYDAKGRRVQKVSSSGTVDYLYDLGGNVVTEWCAPCGTVTGWLRGYIYFGGQRAAEYFAGTTYFVHADHLGSARLLTGVSGSVVDSMDYLPYGEQISGGGTTTHKFTGDERDSETNLDHTLFRQYASSQGRWTTPDPAGLAAANPANPQSWNRYAYALNTPAVFTDRSGLVPLRSFIVPYKVEPCWDCDPGAVIGGYDIFDAIAGAPGTYLSYDVYGHLSFGFSYDLYSYAANQGPGALVTTGWTYIVQDLGATSVTSGFLVDLMNLQQENAQLAAQLPPGGIADIYGTFGAGITAALNSGQSVPLQNILFDAVGGYLQQYGLDPSLQVPLYQNLWALFQLATSPTNPLNRH